MSKKNEIHINMIVDRMAPDRTPYKAYGLSFLPQRVMVSVPIDSENVTVINRKDEEGKDIETEIDYVVLNLDGLMQLTGRIANSIDDLHNSHMQNIRR